MHTHMEHRKRVFERFRKEGLDAFDEVHVLEMLLFYARLRIDTKPLARRLLEHFGSLPLVLEAKREELMRVEGIGLATATFICFLNDLGRYYAVRREDAPTILNDIISYKAYLRKFFQGRREETVFLLCMDAKKRLLNCSMISSGGKNSVLIPTRRVVEAVLDTNATYAVLAHNHPAGLALPSSEDIQTTMSIAETLLSLECILLDHVIFSDDEAISMVESYMYVPKEF